MVERLADWIPTNSMIATNCNRMRCAYTWTEFFVTKRISIPLTRGLVGCSNARFYRGIVHCAHRDSWRIEGRFSALEKPATTHVHPASFKSKITGVIVACSYTMDHVIGQPPTRGRSTRPINLHWFTRRPPLHRANNPPKVTLEQRDPRFNLGRCLQAG